MSQGHHARCAPSAAERWVPCPGSVVLEAGLPDSAGQEADDGTHTHDLSALALNSPTVLRDMDNWRSKFRSDELADASYAYVSAVFDAAQRLRGQGATVTIYVEEPVSLKSVTGEDDEGTPDACVVALWPDDSALVWVLDLKTGWHEVADDTLQLPIYAIAAIDRYLPAMVDVKEVRTTIVQPKLKSEFETLKWSMPELDSVRARVRSAADVALGLLAHPEALTLEHLVPGEVQCKWCRAARAGKCPAYNAWVHETVYGETSAITDADAQPAALDTWVGQAIEWEEQRLPLYFSRVDAIKRWCEYIEAAAHERLQKGLPVDDGQGHAFKLVMGRKGDRKWADATQVAEYCRALGLETADIYTEPALRTPAAMEKHLKPLTQAFEKLKAFIVQPPGKPTVVAMSDPRPAYVLATADEAGDYSPPEM